MEPERVGLTHVGDRCSSQAECGSGFACDPENGRCQLAYNGFHGVTDGEIKLGASMFFMGMSAELGQAYKLKIQVYLNHINDLGGVYGRQITFVQLDDEDVPATAVSNVTQLLSGDNRPVFALLANTGSATTEAALPVVNENRAVLFAPYTGSQATRLDPPEEYIFNFRASFLQEAAAVTNYLVGVRDPVLATANLMVVAQGEPGSSQTGIERLDAFGQQGFSGVADTLKTHGVDRGSVFFTSYDRGTAAVDTAVEDTIHWLVSPDRVADASGKFEVGIILQAVTAAAVPYITELIDEVNRVKGGQPSTFGLTMEEEEQLRNVELVLTGTSTVANALPTELKFRQGGAKEYCGDIIISQTVPLFSSSAQGVNVYRDHLQTFDANAKAGQTSLEGYLATRVFVQALEDAGPDLTDDVLVEALEEMGTLDIGIGTEIHLSAARHQALDKVWGTALNADCEYTEFALE